QSMIETNLRTRRNISIQAALNEVPVKMQAWPEWWKPYLAAWKRIEGRIASSSDSWPWSLEDIHMAEIKGHEYTVKKAIEYLRKKTVHPITARNNFQLNEWNWLRMNFIHNKKKDIAWRLQHRALPLALTVTIVKEYGRPLTAFLKERLTGSNVNQQHKRKAVLWVNIDTIYEIWYWYTQVKWGKKQIPMVILEHIVKDRISKELKVLKEIKNNVKKDRDNLLRHLIFENLSVH
ncbi:11339_t:CDS:2, partial [Dentiscutata erythropus]